MRRIVLTIVLIAFVTGSGRLIAEPKPSGECCRPKPVGGIQELQKQTIYPLLAEEYRFEGEVIVEFHVDEAGNVTQIKVVQSAGPLFDQSAVEAISHTSWSPAKQNGKPVATICSQEFKYIYR